MYRALFLFMLHSGVTITIQKVCLNNGAQICEKNCCGADNSTLLCIDTCTGLPCNQTQHCDDGNCRGERYCKYNRTWETVLILIALFGGSTFVLCVLCFVIPYLRLRDELLNRTGMMKMKLSLVLKILICNARSIRVSR